MILIVIVSAIAGAVMFYYSNWCTYWRLQVKIEQLEHAGGSPDESYFDPELVRLRESGYLIEFDGMFVAQSKTAQEEMFDSLRAIEIEDPVFIATFIIFEPEPNETANRIRFWAKKELCLQVERIIADAGFIPHSPSQQ